MHIFLLKHKEKLTIAYYINMVSKTNIALPNLFFATYHLKGTTVSTTPVQ